MTLAAPERGSPARDRSQQLATVLCQLSWLVAALLAAGSLVGLGADGVYTGSDATAEMLRGYDLVSVLVVVPGLAISAGLLRQGGAVPHLVVTTLLGAVVYTSAYYLFGTGFNDLFLLHAAVFSAGLVALGLGLASLDVRALAARLERRAKPRLVAMILGVLAVSLGGMWIYLAVDNAVTGDVPEGSRLVETDTVVHLGMALDLTVLVPLYVAAAVLLWRRTPWGYALAGLALLSGTVHQVGYLVAMPFQVAGDVPGAVATDPGEPVIVLLYLVGTALLLRGAVPRRKDRHSRGASLPSEGQSTRGR